MGVVCVLCMVRVGRVAHWVKGRLGGRPCCVLWVGRGVGLPLRVVGVKGGLVGCTGLR